MLLEAIIAGSVVTGFGFCIKSYVSLSDRLTRVEILQTLFLKRNGFTDEDIKTELNNHKNRRAK